MNEEIKNSIVNYFKHKFPRQKFIPGESAVPVSGKVFDEKELLSATEAVLDGWWTDGRFVMEFERELANFIGRKFCSFVNSGSSANLLALTALTSRQILESRRLKKGDEVITTAVAFPTTVNPIVQNGLIPIFIDSEIGSYNADVKLLQKALSPKTKAVFLAHTLGNPYRLEDVVKFCEDNQLWLIEDNCDALGSKYKGRMTGSFGHISTCSFYPAHHITTAEGGAVLTDDPALNKIIRSLRDWGRDCWCPTGKDNTCKNRFDWKLGDLPAGYDHKYIYSEVGFNLKATDIQAAIGVEQLKKLPEFIKKRKENFSFLYNKFKKFDSYFHLPKWEDEAEPSWFGFPLTVKEGFGFDRIKLLKFLDERKIGTRLIFAGNITKQPYFKNYVVDYRVAGSLKNTDDVMNNAFWIGIYPGLTEEMLDYVVDSFELFFNKFYKQ